MARLPDDADYDAGETSGNAAIDEAAVPFRQTAARHRVSLRRRQMALPPTPSSTCEEDFQAYTSTTLSQPESTELDTGILS
ncbi:unnamed protein product [Protopolystoma xenopodis]|uniref:Uncharacterized protein n=1 Tax=Protopolystoma xenopodis TaxID=117903 RepID=A0A3S5CIN3_9PLAT|nr:unnamed protein product [Protopolystoma xenopodis]